jgi:thioredoxin-related protein
MKAWLAALGMVLAMLSPASAQEPGSHAIDIPRWFTESFLDFREDIRDAAAEKRRLMVYFGQDGCPYCTRLMATSFSQREIVDKTRKHFVAIALNLWGDREVTWVDGQVMSEKALARHLGVQFTPTLLFFDEQGAVVARLNGYYPPHRLDAVLDYVAGRAERRQPLAEYLATAVKESASPSLHAEPFFLKPPHDLTRRSGGRPLAAVFEAPYCSACDELHGEGFKRAEVRALVSRFDVAQLQPGAPAALTTPDGRATTAAAWARELGVIYTPTIVFFDVGGKEVFRMEAYLRPFHLASSFEYVAEGAYAAEPSFQRYIQGRAERMRARGQRVDLWD